MKCKYVASVMRRHYVAPDIFVFSCDHTVLGNIDEETGDFIDRNGNKYLPMMTLEAMTSVEPICCSNVIKIDDLRKDFPKCENNQELISEYEKSCRDAVFIIARCDDDKLKCLIYDLNSLRELTNDEEAQFEITNLNDLDDKIAEYMAEDDSRDMSENIKELIVNVVNGDYSLEELREIREDLIGYYDDFEQALDSVELQIEATEKGESFITLANKRKKEEEAEELDDVRKVFKRNEQSFTPSINRRRLLNNIKKTLISQDKPTERVVTEIIRKELGVSKKKEAILLTGDSGVGKTLLMTLIAKYINRPLFIIDSTQLTIPGYTGKDIEEELWELYAKCNGDKELAESAIVYFDEIDKKGSGKKSDVSGQGVLNCLLPFIEGSTYQAKPNSKSNESIEISTDNMTVILGGAFTDVYKDNRRRTGIGFTDDLATDSKIPTTDDFVTKGQMTKEFMGRVTVVHLNELSVDDLIRILNESDSSAIQKQSDIFKLLGTNVVFTDDYTRAVAEIAHKKGTGARGLNGIVDDSTVEAFGEVYDHPGEYDEVIFDKDAVVDPSNYQLVKKIDCSLK